MKHATKIKCIMPPDKCNDPILKQLYTHEKEYVVRDQGIFGGMFSLYMITNNTGVADIVSPQSSGFPKWEVIYEE